MEKLIEYINTRKLVVTEEMVNTHNEEYRTTKSGYSNRANLDSEYLEDDVAKHVLGAEAITIEPDRFLADIKYKGMVIDFKEIASIWYNLQHDPERYLEALIEGKLTHFLFFKSNRLRYEQNIPDIIPAGFELTFEFLGLYDVNTVLAGRDFKYPRVNVYNLGDKYGRRIDL